jgi:hypothetical protein
LRHCQSLRFPSPLIEPDVRISRIRLSDWIHRMSFGPAVPASISRAGANSGLERAIELSPTDSDLEAVFRGLSTNHLIVSIFKSAPEVRDLPSPGITRLHRYYVPVRLPPDPSPSATLKPRPPIERVSPVARFTLPACRAQYPGGSNRCTCRLLPRPCGLPRFAGGSASASLLSRPAQSLLALRPVELLNRPKRPLSRGFDPASRPAKPLVSYRGNAAPRRTDCP